jgi:AcrR family transcriptional regulator
MSELSTKDKILIAARKLFVAHGFSGTSIGKIAKLAEVNHSLVFHHFGNKEKLWLDVKQSIVLEAKQRRNILPDTALPFPDFLYQVISNSIHFYQNNPDILRMINWQRLELNTEQKIGVTLSAETQAWLSAFKHYQQKGDINNNLKLEFIITLVLSLVSSAGMDQYVFISNTFDKEAYIDFCAQSLRKALM